MTKEDAIKQAWIQEIGLEAYEEQKDSIDKNGWNQKRIWSEEGLNVNSLDYEAVGHGVYIQRPKGLRGIENNNGWIKIESESDLPKEGNIFWVMKIGYNYPIVETLYNDDANYWIDHFTHYQPIDKPKLPIY